MTAPPTPGDVRLGRGSVVSARPIDWLAAAAGAVSSEATVLTRRPLSWRERRRVRRALNAGTMLSDPATTAYAAALAADLDRTSVQHNPVVRWLLVSGCAVLVLLNALAESWLAMAGVALTGATQAWYALVMPRRWARYPMLAEQALEQLSDRERHTVAMRSQRPLEIAPTQLFLGRIVVGGVTFALAFVLMSLLDLLNDRPIGVAAGAIISAVLAFALLIAWAVQGRGIALAEFRGETAPRS